ncbi:MAG: hypothetical protein AAGD28_10710 [Bacteroidota bacterium]
MTKRAQNIVAAFQDLTLAELWTIAHAALARIHAQSEELEIPQALIDQVREESQLFKVGKLNSRSVEEAIDEIRKSL